jgi:GT2 family glycosyltransferase
MGATVGESWDSHELQAFLKPLPSRLGNLMNIAAIMTCHNRRIKTLASLRALYASAAHLHDRGIKVHVYLTDDGSTDDTRESVHKEFPYVQFLEGNGQLYWNGGMRVALAAAESTKADFYLWLNDDTSLYPEALAVLLDEAQRLLSAGHLPIVVGSVVDPVTGRISYGGVRQHRYLRGRFELMQPTDVVQRCSTMNGNCTLIPQAVMQRIGNLDATFIHGGGDFDYGLRAASGGCSVWLAPGILGDCAINSTIRPWLAPNISLQERLRRIRSPKGLPPESWYVFTRRHTGILWAFYWIHPYLRLLVSHILQAISNGKGKTTQ